MEVRSSAGPMAKDDEARLGKENGQILPNVKITSGSGHRGRDETQTRESVRDASPWAVRVFGRHTRA